MASDSFVEHNSDEEVFEEGGIRIGDIYIPPPPPPACTFDPTGPRLIISHIINENFKSYAGRQGLGPFHKNFTCIVGPNGSGKSNVIDSMLFVFGYRAQKIRSKKISVLIHNSQQHPNVQSCTVAVYFQKVIEKPGGEFEVVPGSEFNVARTANKDNSSWYSINGKRCQFKEVSKLLRFHGIDLDHNRFLILQGEVEMIAMMKPKALTENETGMLEYLEDIIGSNRFEKPIELLAKRIEELNEERGEKLNRVKIVEKEKDNLEGPKNEAVEFLTLENSIVKKKNILYQHYILENKALQDEAEAKKKEIEESMSELLTSLKEVQTKRKDQEKEHKTAAGKYEAASKTIEETKTRFSEFEQQDIRCREDIKHAKTKAKKLQQTVESEKKSLDDLQKVPSKNEAEIEEMKTKRESLEVKKKKEEEEVAQVMASLKTETKSFQDDKDLLEKKLVGLKEKEDDTKSKMNIANSELEIYLSNEVKEKARLEELQKNYDEAKKLLDEKQTYIKDLKKEQPSLEKALYEAKSEYGKVQQDSSHITDELRSKRQRVEEARSAMNASKSQSKVLNALMQQKANGNIPGILGRLGDLGAIDEKYDIAISTACGPLDNIVTDTIDTAQKCVNFLKKSNIGIATFIGLDKMERWKPYTKQRIITPENVPRLFDLVRVNDDKILPAFYFALRDTLVANDLDQATRIAFQGSTRYRVVSLQGHLIDQSGTMSGGGNQVSKGRMGSQLVSVEFTPQQINSMMEEVDALTSKSSNLNHLRNELEVKIEQLSRQLEQNKTAHQRYERETEVLTQQVSTFDERRKDQEARVKAAAPDKNKVKSLTATVTSLKTDYEKAAKAVSEIDKEVQRLHKKIMEITNSKMKNAQQKLDDVNKKIDLIDGAITKANVAIKTAQRNMKKSETKIKNMEAELQENNNKVTKMNEELSELEAKAKKVMAEMEGTMAVKNKLEEELTGIKEVLSELQTKENELNKEKLSSDHELEKWVGKIADSRNKRNHWIKEKKKLSLHQVEGQEGEEPEELKDVDEEELKKIDLKALQYDLHVEQENLGNMKPNMAAIAEFKRKEQQYLQRVGELNEVVEQRDSQRKSYEDLRKQRLNEFMKGFSIITNKLKEMYQMITLGGDAELELKDSTDPFSEGIVFSVRPPKKSWKEISNLSGGEKTLSSLALVFALHFYKPTPLYVMDEIDAALDFKNVSIIAYYIKEKTKNAQFIIISLRNHMFELGDRLVGIYKTYNCTKSVAITPHIYKNYKPKKKVNEEQNKEKDNEEENKEKDSEEQNKEKDSEEQNKEEDNEGPVEQDTEG